MFKRLNKIIVLFLSLLMIGFNANYEGDEISFKKDVNLLTKRQIKFNNISDELDMASFDFTTKHINFFNSDLFKEEKMISTSSLGKTENVHWIDEKSYYVDGYNPSIDNNQKVSNCTILGNDDRNYVYTEAKEYPCRTIALMVMTYNNVLNKKTGKKVTLTYKGTAFLVGPNIVLSAGHCVCTDVSKKNDLDNGIFDPCFPDKIEFYFGADGSKDVDKGSSYEWYAKANVAYIQRKYYESTSFDYDWSAIQLDRNIGYELGWNGRIANFYKEGATIESYGYPGDKPKTMWSSIGTMKNKTEYKYITDLDSYKGQSGSPYFVSTSLANHFVCGIHTSGYEDYNAGTIINDFIFSFLNTLFDSSLPDNYLGLRITKKDGLTWSLKVTNPLNQNLTVEYNSKMCFYEDAEEWKNLKDIKTIKLNKGSSCVIEIGSNWFATSVAVSYKINSIRYISYADNLNKDSKTMNLHYNYFSI